MRLLLHNTQTGLFYAGSKDWTADPTQAVDFKRPDLALDLVSEAKLDGVELVLRFDESAIDFPVTIYSAGR
jgi:hypothetical protein